MLVLKFRISPCSRGPRAGLIGGDRAQRINGGVVAKPLEDVLVDPRPWEVFVHELELLLLASAPMSVSWASVVKVGESANR